MKIHHGRPEKETIENGGHLQDAMQKGRFYGEGRSTSI